MFILRSLIGSLQTEFRKAKERGALFAYTLIAIILPLTASRASGLLRSLVTLFGLKITTRRFYIFMASPKIPWERLWLAMWKLIQDPSTNGRLLLAGDDSINPKTGKKIHGCHSFFDHAAKQNQAPYAWSQNIVQLGLLKLIHGRFACLPLAWCFYRLQKDTQNGFQTKIEQMVAMVIKVSQFFQYPLLLITDSWFGNNGVFAPLRKQLGLRVHMLSRFRTNSNLFALPKVKTQKGRGRPKKYGKKRGTAKTLSSRLKSQAKRFSVFLYGKKREVSAVDGVFIVKTLKVPVRVVWIFYRKQWVALFTTDLTLTVEQIIEYYGARWKIESGFKELKQEIGSNQTQAWRERSVKNHLHFCMMAVTFTWIYASRLATSPVRRHLSGTREHYAFSDVRRLITEAVAQKDFNDVLPKRDNTEKNNLIKEILKLAA